MEKKSHHTPDKDELVRFGVSFPAVLIEQFDRYIREQGYTNRSEAFRDLARRAILEPSRFTADQRVAGTIVMVYDHHSSDIPQKLTELQHTFYDDIISTMHIHLNSVLCLEVIAVRGEITNLRALHQRIQVMKGVFYAELSVTYFEEMSAGHAHD
ncbi:MAG: Nickel responsive regulator NikR [Candidatus Carbobacillus altaicus]|uniref:Putative nickel-responsive regulator n=1 Tax=Candidatus Carbonibacillus altaicus TaxID=2163959 RepID=A0A2R6Y540_9BACL|nr:MAG: Nickel responsive regulator NikR [Candidatus Carbobacillus altaicus]